MRDQQATREAPTRRRSAAWLVLARWPIRPIRPLRPLRPILPIRQAGARSPAAKQLLPALLLAWAAAAGAAGPGSDGFRLPPPPPAPLSTAPQTTLRAVRFEGHTQLELAELEALAAPFLNRPLRPLDLEELRQRVTRAYVERGYVNSGALITDDALQGDTLTLRIVEGRITRLRQSGLEGLRA